jgi:hypothetical protein
MDWNVQCDTKATLTVATCSAHAGHALGSAEVAPPYRTPSRISASCADAEVRLYSDLGRTLVHQAQEPSDVHQYPKAVTTSRRPSSLPQQASRIMGSAFTNDHASASILPRSQRRRSPSLTLPDPS